MCSFNSQAAAEYCITDWENHEENLNDEVQFLLDGSNNLTPEFRDRMWRMVLEEETYNRVKNNLSDGQTRETISWMLKNRYDKLRLTKGRLRELRAILNAHHNGTDPEEAFNKAQRDNHDRDSNGGNGGPGLTGLSATV
jgi:hypothetical protein